MTLIQAMTKSLTKDAHKYLLSLNLFKIQRTTQNNSYLRRD